MPLAREAPYTVIIDAWDPKTFSAEVSAALTEHSTLIFDYHVEDRRLMDEHLRSTSHQSLMPNRLSPAYQYFQENVLTPIVARSRIRVWHYTRMTDEEAGAMRHRIVPSSLEHLRSRLGNLVAKSLISQENAETAFDQSPFHKQPNRAGCLCATVIPLSYCDSGVKLLLESWGGESAYFWLRDEDVAETLKSIGLPRIFEIETALTDKLNGYSVAQIFSAAWARKLGAPAALSGCDLFIRECIDTTKVLRIHTKGDNLFEAVRTTYPVDVGALLENGNEFAT